MNSLTAFEVQSFRESGWKIETVTDDKDLAIFEAQRLAQSPHISRIRVVEETFDPDVDRYKSKVVFSRSKGKKTWAQIREKPKPDPAARPAAPPPPPAPPVISIGMVLTFTAIVLAGITLILVMRYVAQLG